MLISKESNFSSLNYFIVALIFLLSVIYVNPLFYHLLFEILISVVFFLFLLPVHLLPPLLLCPLYSSSDCKTLLFPPSPYPCYNCCPRRLISTLSLPIHTPPPISPLTRYHPYCPHYWCPPCTCSPKINCFTCQHYPTSPNPQSYPGSNLHTPPPTQPPPPPPDIFW